MVDTVECPYCKHDNDMKDGLIDLPSNNRFDHECESCEREFEVYVEFSPSYSGVEIEYVQCQKCSRETRDIVRKGRTFPYPKNIKEEEICQTCYFEEMSKEYKKND